MDCVPKPKQVPSLIKSIEPTPNTNSYKISLAIQILPNDMWESDSKESDCLLASEIFAKTKVARIFIHDNLIVVTKHDEQTWDELVDSVQQTIHNFFSTQMPVFKKSEQNQLDGDYLELIREVIRDYIQPAVVSDGGFVRLHGFEDGVVKISMHGACSNCPSSEQTLRGYIQRILQFRVPDIISVELVT
jgi:Fe-S cluster biogenesis protein NfuA